MATQYETAALIIGRILRRETTTRAVFEQRAGSSESDKASPAVLQALVCETLKHRAVIQEMLPMCGRLATATTDGDEAMSEPLLWVLVYELMFGKGKIVGGGRAKRRVDESRGELQAALARVLTHKGVDSVAALLPQVSEAAQSVARFARVNTLKSSVDDALAALAGSFSLLTRDADGAVPRGSVAVDRTIPYVVEFSAGTADLHNHALVRAGALVLQDKASCLPAHCLMPPPDAIVIDACAAPGNKTTQLAALMGADASGTILAFDRDKKRYETLRETIARLGTRVDSVCADFVRCAKAVLKPEPNGNHFAGPSVQKRDVFRYLATATHALVDPSCSGSGVVTRDAGLNLEHDVSGSANAADRIEKLARFQREALVSAMMLPAMQRVVYSTCSVHARENEDVVRLVLEDPRLRRRWRLIDPMPSWTRRGLESSGAIGKLCLRTDPTEDRTSGFFVALFERLESGTGGVSAAIAAVSGADSSAANATTAPSERKRKSASAQPHQQQEQRGKKKRIVKRPLTSK